MGQSLSKRNKQLTFFIMNKQLFNWLIDLKMGLTQRLRGTRLPSDQNWISKPKVHGLMPTLESKASILTIGPNGPHSLIDQFSNH